MMRSPDTVIVAEAAEWLATLSDPNCTGEERRTFTQWLKRSNLHVEEFLRISTLMRRLESFQAWPAEPVEQLPMQERQSAAAVVEFPLRATRKNKEKSRRAIPVAIAAAMALAVVWLALPTLKEWMPGKNFSTGVGELRSVTLEDGSIVQLNARSSIRAKFNSTERTIDLERGEAIFKVSKDAQRSFKVWAGDTPIVALGTQFNVYRRAHQTEVTVLEGRVGIAGVELGAGEQATVRVRQPVEKVGKVDPVRVVAWTERRLYFDDTPLAEAVAEFSRYSADTIRIEDPALAQRRITGTFDSSDPAALVEFLRRHTATPVGRSASGWVLGELGKTRSQK